MTEPDGTAPMLAEAFWALRQYGESVAQELEVQMLQLKPQAWDFAAIQRAALLSKGKAPVTFSEYDWRPGNDEGPPQPGSA